MRKFNKYSIYPINIEPMEEGGFFADCPSLQGCHAEGEDIADTIKNIQDVIKIHLEARQQNDETSSTINIDDFSSLQLNLPIPV